MVETTLQTTIILRNDLTANWASSTLILKKGEVAIDTEKNIFKIGDGEHTFSQIEKYFVSFDEVVKAITEATKNLHTTDVYEAEVDLGADKLAALKALAPTPVKGDIGIVKEKLSPNGKYQYTAYVYDGDNWAAMDGNYNAENVYFQKDLTITAPIGVQTIPSSGSKVLNTTGKNILEVFDLITSEEKNPTTTRPSVTLNSSNIGAKEVGENPTISYSFVTNVGSYTYGPPTGVTFDNFTATFNGETLNGQSGTFKAVQVTDSTNLAITGTCTSTEGATPLTNKGNAYDTGKIQARDGQSPYRVTKGTLTGYRGWFYGYYNGDDAIANPASITSAQLRAFGTKTSFPTTMNTTKMQQMFFASPKGKVSSISISNAVNGAPLTVTKGSASVEGANGYTAAEYDLFYVANAVAEGGDSKWNIVAK